MCPPCHFVQIGPFKLSTLIRDFFFSSVTEGFEARRGQPSEGTKGLESRSVMPVAAFYFRDRL